MPLTREALEGILGCRVIEFEGYRSVFTHRSASRETGVPSYERYEYMGDAVINFVVAKYLYDRYPGADEGFLTKVRTKLVSGKFLAGLSQRLGLPAYVTMNGRAFCHRWYTNYRIMEDVFESLVGCMYLDLGLATAKNFVLGVIERHSSPEDALLDTNYKDALIRHAHARAAGNPQQQQSLPEYRVLNDPHVTRRAMFDVVVVWDGAALGRGQGASKKDAEQLAAQATLGMLGVVSGAIS